MKEPHLKLMGGDGDIPLWGVCSACDGVTFPPDAWVGSQLAQKQRLESLFLEHFNKVHAREDASQAAARILREATEGK